MHTFTGFFNTTGVDAGDRCVSEQGDARLIATRFGTTHHEREIAPQDVIDTLPAIIVYEFTEPIDEADLAAVSADIAEIAEVLGISERTVKRDWAFARAWLLQELEGEA